MKQPVLFGEREAAFLVDLTISVTAGAESTNDAVDRLKKALKDRDQKKNLKAMSKSAAGLTAALFGRFVTSDILARVDAPVHVAHAITVHAAETEMDYFTVVDDLNRDDESGAAHANESELGAGVYYGYVAVVVPLLVTNLSGCETDQWHKQDHGATRRVLKALVRTVAEQSPGAKLGATAPYSRAECVLLEAGRAQPRTLSNAYLQALTADGDLMQHAVDAMADYVTRVDRMYGQTADCRALASLRAAPGLASLTPVPLDAAVDIVLGGAFPQR
jgi:CRISPR system Cascade subunit CasC